MTQDFDPEKRDELLELLGSNRKLEAVKRYRDWTRCSLRDAKNAVEQLQQTGTLRMHESSGKTVDSDAMDEVLDAIERGNKIEACKLYKEQTRCSLKEAKDFVESLMDELDQQPVKAGCLLLLLTSLLAVATTATLA